MDQEGDVNLVGEVLFRRSRCGKGELWRILETVVTIKGSKDLLEGIRLGLPDTFKHREVDLVRFCDSFKDRGVDVVGCRDCFKDREAGPGPGAGAGPGSGLGPGLGLGGGGACKCV